MSESIGYLGEQYEHLKAQIDEAEQAANDLPHLRERLAKVAELIKAYVSDPGLEPAEEPEPIEPLTDLTGVDYAPAFEGYQPNGALPETD